MPRKAHKFERGISLIEVLVACVIISFSAVGVLSYQYHAAKQTRMAVARSAASEVADLVLQDWKANGGSVLYASGSLAQAPNPTDLGLGFQKMEEAATYKITASDIPMQVTLKRPSIQTNPIPIQVTVQWKRNFKEGRILSNDPSVVMTTYARIDQTGG